MQTWVVVVKVEPEEVVEVLVGASEEAAVAVMEAEVEVVVALGPMWRPLRRLYLSL
jgi:hypothetical protein